MGKSVKSSVGPSIGFKLLEPGYFSSFSSGLAAIVTMEPVQVEFLGGRAQLNCH